MADSTDGRETAINLLGTYDYDGRYPHGAKVLSGGRRTIGFSTSHLSQSEPAASSNAARPCDTADKK